MGGNVLGRRRTKPTTENEKQDPISGGLLTSGYAKLRGKDKPKSEAQESEKQPESTLDAQAEPPAPDVEPLADITAPTDTNPHKTAGKKTFKINGLPSFGSKTEKPDDREAQATSNATTKSANTGAEQPKKTKGKSNTTVEKQWIPRVRRERKASGDEDSVDAPQPGRGGVTASIRKAVTREKGKQASGSEDKVEGQHGTLDSILQSAAKTTETLTKKTEQTKKALTKTMHKATSKNSDVSSEPEGQPQTSTEPSSGPDSDPVSDSQREAVNTAKGGTKDDIVAHMKNLRRGQSERVPDDSRLADIQGASRKNQLEMLKSKADSLVDSTKGRLKPGKAASGVDDDRDVTPAQKPGFFQVVENKVLPRSWRRHEDGRLPHDLDQEQTKPLPGQRQRPSLDTGREELVGRSPDVDSASIEDGPKHKFDFGQTRLAFKFPDLKDYPKLKDRLAYGAGYATSTIQLIHEFAHEGLREAKNVTHFLGAAFVFLLATTSFLATVVGAGALGVVISPTLPYSNDFLNREFYFLEIKLPEPVTFLPDVNNYYRLGPFGHAKGDRAAGTFSDWPSRGRPRPVDPNTYLLKPAQVMEVAKSLFMSYMNDVTSAVGEFATEVTSVAGSIGTEIATGAREAATGVIDTGKKAGEGLKTFGEGLFSKRDLAALIAVMSEETKLSEPELVVLLQSVLEQHGAFSDYSALLSELLVQKVKSDHELARRSLQSSRTEGSTQPKEAHAMLVKRGFFGDVGKSLESTFTGIGNKALEGMKDIFESIKDAFDKLTKGFDTLRDAFFQAGLIVKWFEYVMLGLLLVVVAVTVATILVNLHWGLRSWARLDYKRVERLKRRKTAKIARWYKGDICYFHCCCCCSEDALKVHWSHKERHKDNLLRRAHGGGLVGCMCIWLHKGASFGLLCTLPFALVFAGFWFLAIAIITFFNAMLRKLPLPPPWDFNVAISKWTIFAAYGTAGGLVIAALTSPVLMRMGWRYVTFGLKLPFKILAKILKMITYPFRMVHEGLHDLWWAFRDTIYRIGTRRTWVTNPEWQPQKFGPAFRKLWRGPWQDMKRWWYEIRHTPVIWENKWQRTRRNCYILCVYARHGWRVSLKHRIDARYPWIPKKHRYLQTESKNPHAALASICRGDGAVSYQGRDIRDVHDEQELQFMWIQAERFKASDKNHQHDVKPLGLRRKVLYCMCNGRRHISSRPGLHHPYWREHDYIWPHPSIPRPKERDSDGESVASPAPPYTEDRVHGNAPDYDATHPDVRLTTYEEAEAEAQETATAQGEREEAPVDKRELRR